MILFFFFNHLSYTHLRVAANTQQVMPYPIFLRVFVGCHSMCWWVSSITSGHHWPELYLCQAGRCCEQLPPWVCCKSSSDAYFFLHFHYWCQMIWAKAIHFCNPGKWSPVVSHFDTSNIYIIQSTWLFNLCSMVELSLCQGTWWKVTTRTYSSSGVFKMAKELYIA